MNNVALLMVFGHRGHPGLSVVKYVVVEPQQGQDLAMECGAMETLVQEAALKIEIVMINVVLLMVFGHRGHPGQHVAKHVEEDHQQDQDLAVVRHVVENLVLEAALKTNVVMKDVVVLMVFGHPGHPGLNAARHVVEENPEEEDHAVKEAVVESLA